MSDHKNVMYDFKVQTSSLNKVSIKCRNRQNYIYYIMFTFLPNKVKSMRQIS